MFVYEKKLQYPINIKNPNPKLAKIIITQYGGAYSKMLQFYYDMTFDDLKKLNKYQIKALEAEFHDIYNENISIKFYF